MGSGLKAKRKESNFHLIFYNVRVSFPESGIFPIGVPSAVVAASPRDTHRIYTIYPLGVS